MKNDGRTSGVYSLVNEISNSQGRMGKKNSCFIGTDMSTHKKDSQVLHVDYRCGLESRPKRTSPRPNPTMIEMMYTPWNVLDAR